VRVSTGFFFAILSNIYRTQQRTSPETGLPQSDPMKSVHRQTLSRATLHDGIAITAEW